MRKHRMRFTAIVAGSLLVAVMTVHLLAQGNSEVQIGLGMSPVAINTQGLNVALVGRGSYIVNGPGNCSMCHTPGARYLPGGNPFLGEPKVENTAGFLGGDRPFGAILSRNLTPDAQGRPGGLTLQDFMTTMRTGKDVKALPPATPSAANDLLQIMPWPQYQNLTDTDLRAIYEYLKALPCLNGGPGLPANRCTP